MKNILIADDEVFIRNFYRSLLTRLCVDAEIIEAKDGHDALDKLASNHIDLMTVDINMPIMNGASLIKAVREQEQYAELPIVVLTSQGQEDIIDHIKNLGVSDFIMKLDATTANRTNPLLTAICKHLCPDGCPAEN